MRRLAIVAAVALSVGAPSFVGAQPGMPDISTMSGIPRPDPSVPAGQVVVRVVRGDFAHPMVGTVVKLVGAGADRTAPVGEDGRATFTGLPTGGTCTVTATSGEQTLTSQQIPLLPEAGIKVMLVFKPDEKAALGEHDGVARADKSLPAGTVVISLQDEGGKPLAGAELVVAHGAPKAGGGDPVIGQSPLTTDDKGEARYVVQANSPAMSEGLLVSFKRDPLTASSQPFQLDPAAGMRLGLRAVARSADMGQVSIRSSHVIFEISDDAAQVMEVFLVQNAAAAPVDPGPNGLVFSLPAGARGGEPLGQVPASFSVANGKAVLRGPIPTGGTQIAFGFFLPLTDVGVELAQTLPVRLDQLQATTSAFPGLVASGPGVKSGAVFTRDGRSWVPIMGAPVEAGGTLRLTISGLPRKSPAARYLAVTIALLIAGWGLWAGFGGAGRGAKSEVERLEAEKQRLLDELAALERSAAAAQAHDAHDKGHGPSNARSGKAEAKQARRHEELVDRLEHVMRDLDDHHAE